MKGNLITAAITVPRQKNGIRILYVGYGFHPRISGGASQIQWEVLKNSRELGYEPVIFQGGSYGLRGGTRLERKTLDGMQLFDLINSPNRPGLHKPLSEVSNNLVLNASREVLDAVKPDIVHIHELTFHCATLIDECRSRNIPVIKTIHNYWDVCPERDLLYEGESRCTDYAEGRRCVDCRALVVVHPKVMAMWNLLWDGPFFNIGQRIWRGWRRFKSAALRLFRPLQPAKIQLDETAVLTMARSFAYRRDAMLRSLNKTDRIHVYSHRSGEILRHYGVAESRIQFLPISTEAIDRIEPSQPRQGKLPILFGYRGGLAAHKGINVLIEAFRLLDQAHAKLLIYGAGHSEYMARLRMLAANANIEFKGGYAPEEIGRVNLTIDVGIIPSVWEEVFGLVGVEYIQSRVPIIASNIGGITDYVVHGENGFLVSPGDPIALANAMRSFVERPALVRDMGARISRWITVQDMARNLDEMYRSVLRNS